MSYILKFRGNPTAAEKHQQALDASEDFLGPDQFTKVVGLLIALMRETEANGTSHRQAYQLMQMGMGMQGIRGFAASAVIKHAIASKKELAS